MHKSSPSLFKLFIWKIGNISDRFKTEDGEKNRHFSITFISSFNNDEKGTRSSLQGVITSKKNAICALFLLQLLVIIDYICIWSFITMFNNQRSSSRSSREGWGTRKEDVSWPIFFVACNFAYNFKILIFKNSINFGEKLNVIWGVADIKDELEK